MNSTCSVLRSFVPAPRGPSGRRRRTQEGFWRVKNQSKHSFFFCLFVFSFFLDMQRPTTFRAAMDTSTTRIYTNPHSAGSNEHRETQGGTWLKWTLVCEDLSIKRETGKSSKCIREKNNKGINGTKTEKPGSFLANLTGHSFWHIFVHTTRSKPR